MRLSEDETNENSEGGNVPSSGEGRKAAWRRLSNSALEDGSLSFRERLQKLKRECDFSVAQQMPTGQRFPTFLARGTGLVEGNFSTDGGGCGGDGSGSNVSDGGMGSSR